MEIGRMGRRIALLSNVNMNGLIRMLKKNVMVYEAEGYGNELGVLMNPASSYHGFQPEITFLVMDILELMEHEPEADRAKERVEDWFTAFESALQDTCVYYISDAYLWGLETEVADACINRRRVERIWDEALEALCRRHANVRIFPYHQLISRMGEESAFSPKMWYMGRILLSMDAQKRLAKLILEKTELEYRVPKKVLVLDLDNTLWGGLAGEREITPVQLSEEQGGLAYKNLQRVILWMQKQGVLLAIASKNNVQDAEDILNNHPHMVLRPRHFAASRINWNAKSQSLKELAEELNLGLDSFVFWDDNPQERFLIKQMLPEVMVPDFPEKPEELAPFMTAIFHTYFEKPVLTGEDWNKTRQYAENAGRTRLKAGAASFEEYLKQLKIVVTRVDASKHAARLEALFNKTNQFNLTTRRHTQSEVQTLLKNPDKRIFLYRVEDCFGDNGIVAAVVVDVSKVPVIEEFVMSCRVMGRNVEQGIVSHVEKTLCAEGFDTLRGRYIPTAKNKPVAGLYEELGYRKLEEKETEQDAAELYERRLFQKGERAFVGEIREEL